MRCLIDLYSSLASCTWRHRVTAPVSSVTGHTQDTTPDVAISDDSRRPGNDTESVQRGQESSNVVKAGPRSGQAEFKRGQRQIRGQGRQNANVVKSRYEVRNNGQVLKTKRWILKTRAGSWGRGGLICRRSSRDRAAAEGRRAHPIAVRQETEGTRRQAPSRR